MDQVRRRRVRRRLPPPGPRLTAEHGVHGGQDSQSFSWRFGAGLVQVPAARQPRHGPPGDERDPFPDSGGNRLGSADCLYSERVMISVRVACPPASDTQPLDAVFRFAVAEVSRLICIAVHPISKSLPPSAPVPLQFRSSGWPPVIHLIGLGRTSPALRHDADRSSRPLSAERPASLTGTVRRAPLLDCSTGDPNAVSRTSRLGGLRGRILAGHLGLSRPPSRR